jgi:flagellar basal-body rod protein FlgB
MSSVGDPSELLLRLMSASTLRARVLSENIANQNVPGYKRRVVRFEELLAARIAGKSGSTADVAPRIDVDKATPSSPDGNNVSLELENNAMRENWLLYETYAAILQSRNEMLRASISEGR